MHFPHCRLEIFSVSHHYPHIGTAVDKIERIGLPGTMVRTLLSRFEKGEAVYQLPQQPQQRPPQSSSSSSPTPPTSTTATTPRRQPVHIQPHQEDTDDWVFSRCILADFTNLREDEAQELSDNDRLCCWASVELRPPPPASSSRGRRLRGQDQDGDDDDAEAGGRWELAFVVQKVGVRDPESGWCECF